MLVYINGEYMPEEQAQVSYTDRAFVYADAIYEVLHMYNGRYFEMEEHLTRMQNGLNHISIPYDVENLRPVMQELLEKSGVTDEGMLYIQVTRGVQPRTHGIPKDLQPTVVAYAKPLQPDRTPQQKGIKTVFYDDIRWHMCHIKTTGLLVNNLAKGYAVENGATDAIFLRGDIVTEATASNLFMVKDGEILTHPNGPLVLPGITRLVAIRLAQELGLPVSERPFTKDELLQADEVFLTGTLSEVTPVVQIESHSVASGEPGPITRRLQDTWVEMIKNV